MPESKLLLHPSSTFRRLRDFLTGYALLGGALSLAGWIFKLDVLIDWWSTGITIKANTALAIIAVASALLLTIHFPACTRLPRIFAAFAAALGTLTLFEHASGINLGIDTLLFYEAPGSTATAAPGRMGLPASSSFLALGVAILMLHSAKPVSYKRAMWLGIIVFGIAMLSITGYLYGAESMYSLPRVTSIAIQSATMIAALALCLVMARPDQEPVRTLIEDSSAGAIARRLLPIAILVPLILGALRLAGFERGYYDHAFGTALRTMTEMVLLSALVWWSVQAIGVRDRSQRHEQSSRERSDQQLLQTLEKMTDGFITFDQQWRFSHVNHEAERFLGRRATDLLDNSLWELFPQLLNSDFHTEMLRAAQDGSTANIEWGDFDPAGHRHFRHRLFPLSDGSLTLYVQDITVQRQAEITLREADRQKDEFLATLAHELRNPLAPIANAGMLISTQLHASDDVTMAAAIINRQVRHMGRLLDDLLDISRISSGRLELRPDTLRIAQVLDMAIETSRPIINDSCHELTIQLPPHPILIHGDPVRLTQVFCNLLNNAAKYTPHGGKIAVVCIECDDQIQISIIDNGIGITPAEASKLFERFARVSMDFPSPQNGIGIGLWLTRSLVELHGGHVEIRIPEAGLGSEFVVFLPTHKSIPTEIEAPSARLENKPSYRRLRLLVVDDASDNANTLANLLTLLGHDSLPLFDGQSAVDSARESMPDGIFLDIGMPVLNGLEVCRLIRSSPNGDKPFIVALTGWGKDEDRITTNKAGFDSHATKPIDLDELNHLLLQMSERLEQH